MENQNQFVTPGSPLPAQPPVAISPEPKPKMKRWKKVLLWIFGVPLILLIIVISLPLILTLTHPGDATLSDNSQLLLKKISVPDNNNGFSDLSAIGANNDFYDPIISTEQSSSSTPFSLAYTDYPNPAKWDQQQVDLFLQKNQNSFTLFDQAVSNQYIQAPSYTDPANLGINMVFYPLNGWREAARAQAIKALSLSRQNQADQALLEAVKLDKIGHEIIVGHNALIGELVGLAIEHLGSDTILHILPYGSPSRAVLSQVQSEVVNDSDNSEGYKDAFRFDYTNISNSIDAVTPTVLQAEINKMISSGEIGPTYAWLAKFGYFYKPNQTKNLYTDLYSQELEAIGNKCELADLDAQTQANGDRELFPLTENLFGKMFFDIDGLSLGGVLTKYCQNDLDNSVAETELAIKQYQMDNNGSLPASLDALVLTYVASVPLDPFDHQPLRYDPNKKILYSVGLKQQDLGGSTGTDWTTMDNPTFQIK